MATVTGLSPPGPDAPIFSGRVIVSVPIACPRAPLDEDVKRRLEELSAQGAAFDDAQEST